MTTAEISNPYRAGSGLVPPHLAGRRNEIGVIRKTLDEIKDRSGQMSRSPFPIMVLAGPRGVGKTTLLGRAIKEARMRGIRAGEIDGDLLSGPQKLLVNQVFPGGMLKKIFDKIDSVRLDYMEAGLTIGFNEAKGDFRSAVPAFLSKKPLLLVLDEAHNCKPEELKFLFTIVQRCMTAMMPISFILAGTPGLEPLLHRCKATYMERSRFLRFNTLSHDEAREALEKPARDCGRPLDSDALEMLLDWSDNYPFFVQLAGRQAWDTSVERGDERITIEDARKGLAEADHERVAFYRKRYTELYRRDLEQFAAQLITVIRGNENEKFDTSSLARRLMEVNEGMDKHSALKAVEDLLEEGYVWDDGNQIYPGINSMFDFIERKKYHLSDRHSGGIRNYSPV